MINIGKYRQLLKESLSAFVDTLFPYVEDEDTLFGFYLEKTAIDRIVKTSFFIGWLSVNLFFAFSLGRVEGNPVPTGLNAFRFGLVIFLFSYAYFKFHSKIYMNAYRTCHGMDLIDETDENVLEKLDPDRDTEALKLLDDTVEKAKERLDVEDTEALATVDYVENRLRPYFKGDEYHV